MEQKLTPALNIKTDGKSELSPEEFQRQLYTWFEDRGLLTELRAHLRMQMINILKSTGIGKNTVRQGISPKLQALNMLIAEFFLHQDYHYSLCVFTTEVPLVNIFPEMPNCVLNNSSIKDDKKSIRWRFCEKDMWDLLEALGITQNTREGDHIKHLYYGTDEESLLTSLVRILHNMKMVDAETTKTNNKDVMGSIDIIKQGSFDIIYENIANLLLRFQISSTNVTQILDLIKFVVSEEKKILEDKYNQDLTSYKKKIEDEVSSKLQEYKDREKDIEKLFHREKKMLEDELHRTQLNMKSCSDSLQKRYEEFQRKSEMLKNKEIEISKKEEQLSIAKKRIQVELEELYAQKDEINVANSREKSNGVKSKILADKVQQTYNQVDMENALLKQTIKQMEDENSNLRSQNIECQNRVKELAEHARKIRCDLLAYENRYGFYTNLVQNDGPSPASSVAMTSRRNTTLPTGGNGEQVYSCPQSSTNIYRRHSRDFKRKPPHRKYNNNTTSSDEKSYTEEILQETKQRLKNLERESEKIDRNFKEYFKKTSFMKDLDHQSTSNEHVTLNQNESVLKFAPTEQNSKSANFKFSDIPSTSAASIFHYDINTVTGQLSTDTFKKKNLKGINDNRLYFQTKTPNEIPEQVYNINHNLESYPVNEETRDKRERDDYYVRNNKSSGQSANSSGILNDILGAVSISNVELSSDKSISINEDKQVK